MRHFLFMVSVLWACSCARGADEWLPMAKGNYWVYRGPTKWTDNGKVKTRTLTLRMEITEILHQGDNLTAAVLKGFPGDFAWYTPGMGPDDHLLVRVGADKYHLLTSDDADKTRHVLAAGQSPGNALLDGGELLIDGPLTKGKHYGEPDQLYRDMYCWVVETPTPFSGRGIKGLPPIAAGRRAFPVSFRTNPDSIHMEVVPGLGIVSYHYVHHGTVAETNLQLVEVHLATP